MDRNRLWMLGSIVTMVAVVVLGWFLGISPQLDAMAAANATREQVESQNAVYEQKLATLKKQFENIGALQTELAGLREAVPSDAGIPAFVGQLDAISKQHDVRLTDISVSDGEPYTPQTPPTPAPVAAGANGAAPAIPTPAPATPTPAPSAAPAGAPAATPAGSLVTADNFVAIPVSVTVHGAYSHVLDFIEGLQKGTRLVLVTGFNTTGEPSAGSAGGKAAAGGTITASISAYVYVLLDPAATPAPAAGAPTTTQTQAAG